MATTTTMNAWAEQLARSLVPERTPRTKSRKHLDHFNRMLKHHSYARTNQFEVQEKLDGLEEKFHVLNREELSDALHERRLELTEYQLQWVPDVLHLFLELSHRPLRYTQVEKLSTAEEVTIVPASLNWSDIKLDDPIDHHNSIWRLPDYNDFSSDDEALPSSADTSPVSQKQTSPSGTVALLSDLALRSAKDASDAGLVSTFNKHLFWQQEEEVTVTEAQVIREMLFMVQGLPTALFQGISGQAVPKTRFKLEHLSPESVGSVLSSTIEIARSAQVLRSWRNPHRTITFMQVLEDNLNTILRRFDSYMAELQSEQLRKTREGGVVSLLGTVEQLRMAASAPQAAQAYIEDVEGQDPIRHLDVLYDHVCKAEQLDESEACSALIPVFASTIKSYGQQLHEWLQAGTVPEISGGFFVERAADQTDKARLWQSLYCYVDTGPNRPPRFIQHLAQSIFTCGKTVAFAKAIGIIPLSRNAASLASVIDSAISSSVSTLTPFAAALSYKLEQYITSQLLSSAISLQIALQQNCNLISTVGALSTFYLASSPVATDTLDARIFSHLDRCLSSWNDRFLISDLLSDTDSLTALDIERVIVHSEASVPSTLRTGRRSVGVLANIAFDYLLPWPIANIILPETLASYRRVSLLLIQIRRAKYVLERRAYLRIRLLSASNHPSPRALATSARGLYTTLLVFVTMLYAHLTSCIISPLTTKLHHAISSSSWIVDDLISLHQEYLRSLEFSCLTTKNLKVLKDALIALLDLCVEFGFCLSDVADKLLSTPTSKISNYAGLEGENEEEVSFKEKISKMKMQFRKQLDFLIAGLRGVARSNASASTSFEGKVGGTRTSEQGEMMELLADSIESALAIRAHRR